MINGDLTVNAPNATVNNYADVSGNIIIENVSVNTWNELADGNKIEFKAKGKTLVVKGNVASLDIKVPTNLVTNRQLKNVTVAKDVVVTVRPTVNSTRTTTVTGGAGGGSVVITPPSVPVAPPVVDETKAVVTDKAELEVALGNNQVTDITIKGTLGTEDDYTVYNVERAVTIKGGADAKVFGTFIVKADDVTIKDLAIQNKGDLDGESSTNRGGIYVFAENVTLTNNTITNGLGEAAGLSNAIQIMSPKADNPLSNYVITGNNIIGHENEVTNWSSSGIVIAQNYTPGSAGAYVEAITATDTDYANLLNNNTFTNNKIDLTHQDWSKSGDDVVLYPAPADAAKTAFLAAATSYNPESEVYEYSFDGTDLTIGFDFANLNEGGIAQAVMGAAKDFLNAVFDAGNGNASKVVINMNNQEITITEDNYNTGNSILELAAAVFGLTDGDELVDAATKFVVADGDDGVVTADFTMTVTNQDSVTFTLDGLKATFNNVTGAGEEG